MKKVLIANRGEIALRVIRACHDIGLQTVAVYSKADAEALHVLHADEAICIGESHSQKSYLKIPHILAACEITGADSVHPGYGFLSENANFASICESCGLTFIGPSSQAIALLGNKSQAKALAKQVRCPVIEGSEGTVEDLQQALDVAQSIGYPVFIKAVAGGGGKGIRIAQDANDFRRQFTAAKTEAQSAFGNPAVYLEKMVVNPRHVEIQFAADVQGNALHLGERDCTIQRKRQKLIEETPSLAVTDKMRQTMGEAAVAIAKQAQYHTVGTVEFLLDENNNFYFMEVNTRIQVEHTITEEATGVDLVRLQLDLAAKKPLPFTQKDITITPHVFQFRINAENVAQNFSPCPGLLEYYMPPGGPYVRVDSSCYPGYRIPPYYDSMIAKLIVKGKSRADAIMIAKRALSEFHIGGIHSTIPFHKKMLSNDAFIRGDYNLTFVDRLVEEGALADLSMEQKEG